MGRFSGLLRQRQHALGTEREAELTGDEVLFVESGHRQKPIRAVDICSLEEGDVGAVALEHDGVDVIDDSLGTLGIAFDHGDGVTCGDHFASEERANLATADEEKSHAQLS